MELQIQTRKFYRSSNMAAITLDYFMDGKKVNQFQIEKHLPEKEKEKLKTFLRVKQIFDTTCLASKPIRERVEANQQIRKIMESGSDIEQVCLQILQDRQSNVTFI